MTTTTTSAPRRSATRTRDLVLASLAEATEPVTVIELAEAAGVGKSTLGKHLPALEKEGLATRTPGGRQGRRRLPDTWQAALPAPDTSSGEETSCREGEHTEEASEKTVATASEASAEHTWQARPEVSVSETQHTFPSVASEQASMKEPAVADDAEDSSLVSPESPAPPRQVPGANSTVTHTRTETVDAQKCNPVSGSTRLVPGELKLMVKAVLDAAPGEEFTATTISHLLAGRSIGAIQNNLARLATEGHVVQTCDRPRRYRSAKHHA